jgi:WD40 repeat protein
MSYSLQGYSHSGQFQLTTRSVGLCPSCTLFTRGKTACSSWKLKDNWSIRRSIWRTGCKLVRSQCVDYDFGLERFRRSFAHRVCHILKSTLKNNRAFDGKAKIWSIDRRECVATQAESEKALWAVRWLPKTTPSDRFVTAGADRSISFYREAAG